MFISKGASKKERNIYRNTNVKGNARESFRLRKQPAWRLLLDYLTAMLSVNFHSSRTRGKKLAFLCFAPYSMPSANARAGEEMQRSERGTGYVLVIRDSFNLGAGATKKKSIPRQSPRWESAKMRKRARESLSTKIS